MWEWLKRLSGPVKIGIFFGAIAILMAVVGMIKNAGDTPLTVRSLLTAVVISGGVWGLVSWAIATAAVEVEKDVAARNNEQDSGQGEQEGELPES